MDICGERFIYGDVNGKESPSEEFYQKASLFQSSTVFALIIYKKDGVLTENHIATIRPKMALLKCLCERYVKSATVSKYLEKSISTIMKNIKLSLDKIEKDISERYQ